MTTASDFLKTYITLEAKDESGRWLVVGEYATEHEVRLAATRLGEGEYRMSSGNSSVEFEIGEMPSDECCPECGNPTDGSSGIGHCEHKCHIKTMIPDGVYFLHPEGSAWIAAEFRRGKCVDTTEAANAGTHATANDDWSGCVPSDDDKEVSSTVATAIVREVLGDDVNSEMVIVMKAN